MKESTRHTGIMIGIALIIFASILLYMGFSDSRAYVSSDSSTVAHSEYNDFDKTPSKQPNYGVTPLNLNVATLEDLTSIDGIGEKTALQILSYREEIGGFTSVSQLKEIKGIGDATFAKIEPFLTV